MDMSSPANRAYDDDLDLDLDDDMVTAANAQDDDNMVDDADTHEAGSVDDVMQDDQITHTNADEDLIDYSDEEDFDMTAKNEEVNNIVQPHDFPTQPVLNAEEAEQSAVPARDALTEEANTSVNELITSDRKASQLGYDREEEQTHESTDAEVAKGQEPHETASQEVEPLDQNGLAEDEASQPQYNNGYEVQNNVDAPQDQQSAVLPQIDTTAASGHDHEGPPTPTDTGLHPILFYYEDQEYPMFKSKTCPNGLLKDDNLVSVSLADFIKQCRQRLTIKTNVDLDERYEVLLTFESLRLSVVEDSTASFQTSLKEVLDVYVQLHENDLVPVEEIPPLEIICSLQIKFNNSIVALQNAAGIGKGISEIFEPAATYDESGSIQHEQTDDVDVAHDSNDHEQHEETYEADAFAEVQYEAGQDDRGEEHDEAEEEEGDASKSYYEEEHTEKHEAGITTYKEHDEVSRSHDGEEQNEANEAVNDHDLTEHSHKAKQNNTDIVHADGSEPGKPLSGDHDEAEQTSRTAENHSIEQVAEAHDENHYPGSSEAVHRALDQAATAEIVDEHTQDDSVTHAADSQIDAEKVVRAPTEGSHELSNGTTASNELHKSISPPPFTEDELIDYSDEEPAATDPTEEAKTAAVVHDDEDDLIDYSDEELEPVVRVITPVKRAREISDDDDTTDTKKQRSA